MKYVSGSIMLSKFDSDVKPTKNNRFALRVRIETGSGEAYRAAQTLNLELTREQMDEHRKYQTMFLFAEKKETLERIREGLENGDALGKRSVLVRGNMNEFRARHVDEETGEVTYADNLSIYTNRLQAWNRTLSEWVPISAAFVG